MHLSDVCVRKKQVNRRFTIHIKDVRFSSRGASTSSSQPASSSVYCSPGDIVQKTAFRDVFLEQAEKLSSGVKK